MQTYDLAELGWTPELAAAFAALPGADGLIPARVAAQHRGRLLLYAASGEMPAEPSGRFRHEASPGAFPAVGDWVAVRPAGDLALIEALLPRHSAFTRAAIDVTRRTNVAETEVVAANIDLVLVVTSADLDLNLRRLERYLAAAWQSGAGPCVVLTKVDLAEDPAGLIDQVRAIAPGAEVHPVSNKTGEGVAELRALIGPGRTAALLGSSGVGKSSLVNRLLGEERQAVSEVRADGRGRHTTTHRELLLLPGGGLVLDTPGMRLITPGDDAGLEATFADVEALAQTCRFRDCRHLDEPGCAVQMAVAQGTLSQDRFDGYAKLHREMSHLERKDDPRAAVEQRKRWKTIHKAVKTHMKRKRPDLD